MTIAKAVVTPAAPTLPTTKKSSPKKSAPSKSGLKKAVPKKLLSNAFSPVKAAKKASPVRAAKVIRSEKPKKAKLVRDSFTIPKVEYVVLEALKLRAAKSTRSVKKSELLRAGIKALAGMSDAAFLSALAKVPAIKTGRPASTK